MKFSLNVIFMPKSVTVSKMCHCKQRDFSTNGLGIAKTVTCERSVTVTAVTVSGQTCIGPNSWNSA